MSHTTYDYVNGDPRLWIIHNGDWSGECEVRWTWFDDGQEQTLEWKVDGEELLTGNIQSASFFTLFDNDKKMGQVPLWVVGRAVQLAVRTILSRKVVSFVENL
jgi:hypothetical protein